MEPGAYEFNGLAWIPSPTSWTEERIEGLMQSWARVSNSDVIPLTKRGMVEISQTSYDALPSKDANTLYLITS